MEDRPTNPPSFYADDETELVDCAICPNQMTNNNSNIVDDLGKTIIVCNSCKNKFNLKEV